ncbi:hypothetical protein PoB_004275100 [Plakobranchus ocellatus]|uniref:Protein TsetseEP domain-containing protein n=1 Tax=Plakobranchus ocellatus TaxID=259542 RepID=A0AAV4BBN6_9GAST|nr:hypothetical protein PoB_004275100 [Plakobranchus ocellatus]
MASTLLKLSILVLCLAFVLATPMEEEKQRSRRFIRTLGNFFKRITRWLVGGDDDDQAPVSINKEAESVLIAQGETRETAEDLAEQGHELRSFALSLEDFEEVEKELDLAQAGFWKKLGHALKSLAAQALKIADIVLKNIQAISEALKYGINNVEEILKSSLVEISTAASIVEKSISEAERAITSLGTFISAPHKESCFEMFKTIVELVASATRSFAEVGIHSTKLIKSAATAGHDIAEVLIIASDRYSKSVAITGRK